MSQSKTSSIDMKQLIERVKSIGKEIIAFNADSVDREARFPVEAFNALKAEKLMSCYIPTVYGGMGLSVVEVAKICEVLGTFCGSTAMIYAMHQIQVAIIVHHSLSSTYFVKFTKEIVEKQLILASATTELGVGGDVRSSLCSPVITGNILTLEKHAPVISYGMYADAILITCKKSLEAQKSDQILVLSRKEDTVLKQVSGWDTLGFRGTCSTGFVLSTKGTTEQIFPVPYSDIHRETMHPFSHCVWASLWTGIAAEAVTLARSAVRVEARKNPDVTPFSAIRLAELDSVLFTMRGATHQTVYEYNQLLLEKDSDAFSNFSFSGRVNNLKITSSQLIIEIVGKAMLICGISGYRNDSKTSLGRHLRDAYGASLMVNNDRILIQSSAMQVMLRE